MLDREVAVAVAAQATDMQVAGVAMSPGVPVFRLVRTAYRPIKVHHRRHKTATLLMNLRVPARDAQIILCGLTKPQVEIRDTNP